MRSLLLHICFVCSFAASLQAQVSGEVSLSPDSVVSFDVDEDGLRREELLDQVLTESEDSELLDLLFWLSEHPFDLNKVSKEELETIPGITPSDASAIINYRKSVGRFGTVTQLALVEDIGEEVFENAYPYVTVERPERYEARSGALQLRTRAVRDLQPRKGFEDGSYVGSSMKTYNRLSFLDSPHLEAGALFEKDAGERYSDGFATGYMMVKNWPILSQAIVGDYTVEAGQGLVLWRSSAFGKGSDAVGILKKSGIGPRPYRSTDEFNFLRGIAVTTEFTPKIGTIRLSTFYSRRSLAGSSNTPETISSFYEAGLFRTESELEKRRAANEQLIGGRLQFSSTAEWNIGATYYHSSFDKAVASGRAFDFTGTKASVGGFDGSFQFKRLTVFGELARSQDGGTAGIVGASLAVGPRASMAVGYRDYSPQFNNLHANGFGENDNTKNERGMYVGFQMPITGWIKFSGYVDQFKFPWRTFSNPVPTSGLDIFTEADASITSRLNLLVRFTSKMTEGSESVADEYARDIRAIVDRTQRRFRLTTTYQLTRQLRIRGRLEVTDVNYQLVNRKERGNLFYQDIRYRSDGGFSVEARLIFFDSDSFDSRLYEFENDLRGVFSNPALFGKGRRWYVLLRYKLADIFTISAKYSETQKDGVTSLSSGSSEILGDVDNRLSVQMEVNL